MIDRQIDRYDRQIDNDMIDTDRYDRYDIDRYDDRQIDMIGRQTHTYIYTDIHICIYEPPPFKN